MFSTNQAYSVGLAEGYGAGMTEALTVSRICDCSVMWEGLGGREMELGVEYSILKENLFPEETKSMLAEVLDGGRNGIS